MWELRTPQPSWDWGRALLPSPKALAQSRIPEPSLAVLANLHRRKPKPKAATAALHPAALRERRGLLGIAQRPAAQPRASQKSLGLTCKRKFATKQGFLDQSHFY